ncbi:MAG: hypothetical protein JXB07_07825 [Anaerolineae bacterium]|nr:hypothetical protein [Anaerolineae bacterium]
MKRNLPILIVALAAVINSLIMISQMTRLSDGSPALALDDSYIHLQYAWQTSQGHFLQYNTGDAPTTGATSLLYMLLLAGGFALGITRQAMPGVVLGLGSLLYIISTTLLADTSRRLFKGIQSTPAGARLFLPSVSPSYVGLLAGILFVGSGWISWGFFSGMELGLLIMLIVGAMWSIATSRPGLTSMFVSLAALTRPEMLILGVIVLASEWLIKDPATSSQRVRRQLLALAPLITAAVPFVMNYLLTQSVGSSGLQAKSLFTLIPFDLNYVLGRIVSTNYELFVRLFGGLSSDGIWHTLPLAQVLAGMGLTMLWKHGAPDIRRLAIVCLGWTVLGLLATTTMQNATSHNYRYQIHFYPALLIAITIAAAWIAGIAIPRLGNHGVWLMQGSLCLLAVTWAVFNTSAFGHAMALDTATTAAMQIRLAEWLRQHTDPGSRVVTPDAGAIRFIGERDIVDVIGLTEPGMAQVYRNGPGSIYEELEIAKPDYYVAYPDAAPPYFGSPYTQELLGPELFRVSPQRLSLYVSAADTQVITRPDWSGVELANFPQQPNILNRLDGWEMVDRLDVANLSDELAHGYTWHNQGIPPGFPSDARQMRYRADGSIILADGGRLMTGGESFSLQSIPNQPLILVGRLHQASDTILRVHVNGSDAGQWRLPAVPGEWIESTYLIPANLIIGNRTHIDIAVEEMFDAGPETRYSPFYYWAYQGGEIDVVIPQPKNVLRATFDDVAQLRGYDLSETAVVPGDTLSLTLYWQVLDPSRADLRIFAHLVDPANANAAEGIIAQVDSTPLQGTYPFWVWQPGESIGDMLLLAIPADVPAGEYLLLVGIYDAATDRRSSISNADDFGSGRLLLTRIAVR